MHKAELEDAKKENDVLKQRIRDLEKLIREGEGADGQRGRRGAPPVPAVAPAANAE